MGWQWPTLTVWLLLALISAIGAVGNYAMIKALDHAEAAAVQPYNYTLLLWATLFGFLMFGDMPDRWTILGAAIVVASGL
ncbi:EamA/RhaT family transporter, partial [Pseudomonas sp. GW460-8]